MAVGGLKGSGNLALDGVQLAVGYAGTSTSYDGVLSGTVALQNTGGTLTLNGQNTFSGNTTITGGVIMLGAANALQNSTLDYSSSGNLSFGLLPNATLGGLKGTKSLTLSNWFSSPVILSVGGNNQSTSYSGTIAGPLGSALKKIGSGTLTLGGGIQNCDTILSTGTLQLSNPSVLQYSFLVPDGGTLNAGTFTTVAVGGLKGSGDLALDGVQLAVGYAGTSTTYDGVLSGTMALSKTSSGTLTLTRPSTFSGDTTITGGTLMLATGNALQNSILDYSSSGQISFGLLNSATLGGLKGNKYLGLANLMSAPVVLIVGGNNQSTIFSGTIAGPLGSALRKVGAGTLTLNGSTQCDVILSSGTLQAGAGGALQSSLLTMDGGTLCCNGLAAATLGGLKGSGSLSLDGVQLSVGYAGTSTNYDGVLAGTMGLKKVGAGVLTLTADNTFSGDTTIAGGMLVIASANALQNSTYDATNVNDMLRFGTVTKATLGGLKGDNGYVSLLNAISQPIELDVGNNDQSTIYYGTLRGPSGAALKKIGSGTLTLCGSMLCDTIVSGGTVQVGYISALSASTVEIGGGTLSCGQLSAATLGGLRGTGPLTLNNVQLTVGGSDISSAYGGVLSGSMSLVKTGAGTFTLSGENTFSGSTSVAAGTLELANANALQNSTLLNLPNGTLRFGTLPNATIGALAGNWPLVLANDVLQPVQLTVGGNGQSTPFYAPLSGLGGLTKVGGGTLTLSPSSSTLNSYSGRTIVKAGGLLLVGYEATVAPGAWQPVLDLGGADIQGGKIEFEYDHGGVSPKQTIEDLLAASYDGGGWDVGQFRSTTAAALGLSLGWKDDGRIVTVMPAIPGDFNLDGTVDNLDLQIWYANAFTGTSWSRGDANYDGVVNGLDRDILAGQPWANDRGRPTRRPPPPPCPSPKRCCCSLSVCWGHCSTPVRRNGGRTSAPATKPLDRIDEKQHEVTVAEVLRTTQARIESPRVAVLSGPSQRENRAGRLRH